MELKTMTALLCFRSGTFVTLSRFSKRSISSPVFHNVDRQSSTKELDGGKLRLCRTVEELQNDISLR